MNPFRDSLVLQREEALVTEAQLIAEVFEAQLPATGEAGVAAGRRRRGGDACSGIDLCAGGRGLRLRSGGHAGRVAGRARRARQATRRE